MTATTYIRYTPALLDAIRPPEWLIEDVLPREGYGVLYGKSGCGKSFAALYLAACVAAGLPFFAKKVKQGPVAIVVLEGFGFYARRVRATLKALNVSGDNLYVINGNQSGAGPLLLHDIDSLQVLRDSLKEEHPEGFALVIVDTLARATTGLDENSNSDDAKVSDAVAQLKSKTQGAVLGIHHEGWESGRLRGASARYAACDAILKLTRQGEGPERMLELEKSRDAQDGVKWPARLAPVGGDTIPVFLPSDATAEVFGSEDRQRQILQALSYAAPEGLTGNQLAERCPGQAVRTHERDRAGLRDRTWITCQGRRWHITEAGSAALEDRNRQAVQEVAETGQKSVTVSMAISAKDTATNRQGASADSQAVDKPEVSETAKQTATNRQADFPSKPPSHRGSVRPVAAVSVAGSMAGKEDPAGNPEKKFRVGARANGLGLETLFARELGL